MIRWLRVVWPPGWALACAAFFYVGFEAFFLCTEWAFEMPYYSLDVARVQTGVLGGMLVVYAFYRTAAFHPCHRPGYSQWLATTVWTARKPLPMGPIYLVWQDLLLVAIAVGLAWPRGQTEAPRIILAFGVAYLVCLAWTNFCTGEKHWTYAILFWAGAMALVWTNVWAYAASLIVAYVLVYCGMRRSLRRFPWDSARNIFSQEFQDRQKNKSVGWPYDHLGPRFSDLVEVGASDTLLAGCLAGWWVFAISSVFRDAKAYSAKGAFFLCAMLIFVGCVARICRYCINYYPSIDTAARSLPWFIIPGYDRVLVAPFAAFGVGLLIADIPTWAGFDPFYAFPLAIAAACWILLGMGPSLKVWRLTGAHRIVPGISHAGEMP
jgi:hypothetical protein